jgi:hypothetical protein
MRTLTPKVGVHLGVCGLIPSQSLALQECKCDSHVALSSRTFASPCLGREPKARVVTCMYSKKIVQRCD